MPGILDIAQLRTLVAIAECGGFGRAATVLGVSQPTVSKHVRGLERVIGRAVVEKTGRLTRFTSVGEVLLAEARQILLAHDDAMRRLDANQAPKLCFGVTENADQVLPDVLSALRGAFPQHDVLFRVDQSGALAEATTRGALDLALVVGDAPDAGDAVGTVPLRWCAAPTWSLPRPGEPLGLVAFQEPCSLRDKALRTLERAGWPVRVRVDAAQRTGVIGAALAGIGLALLPATLRPPDGLAEVRGLPDAGGLHLRMAIRPNLDPTAERVAFEAFRGFFAPQP
jgi:DNA-binding transcriptional LysR family regulator